MVNKLSRTERQAKNKALNEQAKATGFQANSTPSDFTFTGKVEESMNGTEQTTTYYYGGETVGSTTPTDSGGYANVRGDIISAKYTFPTGETTTISQRGITTEQQLKTQTQEPVIKSAVVESTDPTRAKYQNRLDAGILEQQQYYQQQIDTGAMTFEQATTQFNLVAPKYQSVIESQYQTEATTPVITETNWFKENLTPERYTMLKTMSYGKILTTEPRLVPFKAIYDVSQTRIGKAFSGRLMEEQAKKTGTGLVAIAVPISAYEGISESQFSNMFGKKKKSSISVLSENKFSNLGLELDKERAVSKIESDLLAKNTLKEQYNYLKNIKSTYVKTPAQEAGFKLLVSDLAQKNILKLYQMPSTKVSTFSTSTTTPLVLGATVFANLFNMKSKTTKSTAQPLSFSAPELKSFTSTKTTPVVFNIPKGITKTKQTQGLNQSPLQAQIPSLSFATPSASAQKLNLRTGQLTAQRLSFGGSYYNPPETPQRSFRFALPSFSLGLPYGFTSNILKGGRKVVGYTPSFTALAFGIRGKRRKKGEITGVSFRPITKGFRFPTGAGGFKF